MRSASAIGASGLLLVLTACGTDGSSLPESTFVPGPSSSSMGLSITGVLTQDDSGCVVLRPDAGEMSEGRVSLLWPVGSIRSASGQDVTISFPGGSPSVRVGEHVTVIGGVVSGSGGSSCVDADNAFEVQDMRPVPA